MAFYLKLATALCLARAVLSDPRVPLSAFSSTYAGRCRAVRKDLGGTLSIRYRAFGPRSLRLVKSVGDETFRLAARGASPRKVMVGGRLWFSRTFRDSEAVIENLVAEDTGQYWCFYSGRESGFDLSLDQRGTGLVLLVVAGPPPSQHSRTASGGERDLRRRAAAGKRHRHRAPRVDHPRVKHSIAMLKALPDMFPSNVAPPKKLGHAGEAVLQILESTEDPNTLFQARPLFSPVVIVCEITCILAIGTMPLLTFPKEDMYASLMYVMACYYAFHLT